MNGGYRTYFDYNGYGQLCILSHEDAGRREEEHYSYNERASGWKDGWERKWKGYTKQGKEQPFGYTGYRYDEMSGSYFAQGREYDPKAGRFLAQDVIGGSIGIPKTLNRYGYCWGNPLILVDLDGRFPSWTEVGEAATWAKDAMTEAVEEAKEAVVKGVTDAKKSVSAFIEEHEEEIQEVGLYVGVGLAIAAGAAVGGPVGVYLAGNFVGGFAGNTITELLNDGDITDPKDKKGLPGILVTSVGMGVTQAGLGKIKTLEKLSKGTEVVKGSAAYWVSKFFGNNLTFSASTPVYILIDGLERKYRFGEKIRNLFC